MEDRNLALELVRVTEAAAITCARSMGKGDPTLSDQLAVNAMRAAFDIIQIAGTVVIGEGELDEAPMLYIGEEVGRHGPQDPKMDIALDPLEGTRLCACGRPGALSVIAMAPQGCFLNAPDIYMNKVAAGPIGRGVIDITKSPTQNLRDLADAKGVTVDDLTAIVLDRPRHEEIIAEIRRAGARIRLIEDGDVDAAIATCKEGSGIDILFGIGGAPEGVLAAAALQCMGGEIQGRLIFQNDEQRQRAQRMMGDRDIYGVLTRHDLAHGDILFAATGVTSGSMLEGVRYFKHGCETDSLVMRSKSGTIRYIRAVHDFSQKPYYTVEGLHQKMQQV